MKRSLVFTSIIFFGSCAFAQQKVTLEEVVTLALEQNYDVQAVRKTAEAASTDKKFSWLAMTPQVSGTGALVWNQNDQQIQFQDASRNNAGEVASNNLTGSIQGVWTLFDGTRMFQTQRRLSAAAEQGETLVKNQMVNTVASVITSYHDVVRQKQQLRAIQEQMSVSEERVKLAQRKLDVGTGIKPELLQAKVDYNTQRAQVFQQESLIAQLKAQLNALTGLKLPETFDVADTIMIDLNIQPESLPAVESNNYSLLAARQNVEISMLSRNERRAEYFPQISLNAAYNFNRTNNTKQINPFGSIFFESQGLNYGLSVTVPILTGFNTRRLNQQARIEVDRQTILFNQQRTNVMVGLRNAFVNYDNARKILLVEEETIGLAKENVAIAFEAFKRGVTTFIELRTAQQSLEQAYNRLIAARFNAKVAETELLRLTGALLK